MFRLIVTVYFLIHLSHGQFWSDNFTTERTNNVEPQVIRKCSSVSQMPQVKLGDKYYYMGTFFKTNWYKAFQYCTFHGMQLATIKSQEENELLTKYILDSGYTESFWLSGTDLGSEGKFYWMSTGEPIKYSDWWPHQPDNYKIPSGEHEHCLCLWNPQGTELKFNDCICSGDLYFICEL